MRTTTSTTAPTTRTARRRAAVGAAGAVLAAAALGGTAAPASADDVLSDAQLMEVCAEGSTDHGVTGGDCTFEAAEEGPMTLEWHRVGDPITNCAEDAREPLTYLRGDVRTVTETWTAGGGVELGLTEDIKISGQAEYSESRSTSQEARTTITAKPGRKNAVTLGTGYVEQKGRMVVPVDVYDNSGNDGGVYVGTEDHYVEGVTRRVPTGYSEGGQDEVGCDSAFRVDPER